MSSLKFIQLFLSTEPFLRFRARTYYYLVHILLTGILLCVLKCAIVTATCSSSHSPTLLCDISTDVTIIESEIEIEFFLENQIESKSIFWLVFVIDFDSRLYWQRQRTAASSKNDS